MKALIVLPLLVAAALGLTTHAQESQRSAYSFAAIGDLPYLPVAAGRQVYPSPQFDRLVHSINSDRRVRFVTHIGDIKSGSTRCDDEVYVRTIEYFNSFRQPVLFTPGDNEWTDCHRDNNGGFDPIERLTFLRNMFFPSEMSWGVARMAVRRQSAEPQFNLYRENAIWSVGPVLYATVHVVGSNNNRGRRSGPFPDMNDAEYTARNAAAVAWLDAAFDAANANPNILGLVVFVQANLFEDFADRANTPPGPSGFEDFVSRLRNRTVASPRLRVLLVSGDSHYFRVDKPLTPVYPAAAQTAFSGNPFLNFTRLEVFGSALIHWVRVDVDRANPDLFAFRPVIVQGN